MSITNPKWEIVIRDPQGNTERLRIPEGWLYCRRQYAGSAESGYQLVMAFVPDQKN